MQKDTEIILKIQSRGRKANPHNGQMGEGMVQGRPISRCSFEDAVSRSRVQICRSVLQFRVYMFHRRKQREGWGGQGTLPVPPDGQPGDQIEK